MDKTVAFTTTVALLDEHEEVILSSVRTDEQEEATFSSAVKGQRATERRVMRMQSLTRTESINMTRRTSHGKHP